MKSTAGSTTGASGSVLALALEQSSFCGATTFPAAKPPDGTKPLKLSPQKDSRPVVFLNYEESYLQGRVGDTWSRTAAPLRPPQGTFDIAASHTNASQHNKLQVGLEFRNTTDKTVKLTLSTPLVSDLPVYARDPQQTVKADEDHGRQLLDLDSLVKPPAMARALSNDGPRWKTSTRTAVPKS